jgi:hypothetical protein
VTDSTQLDPDVTRYVELDALKANIEIEQAAIKERLRELGTGAHVAPCGIAVSVAANRRFNPELAAQVVPPPLLEQIQSLVIDTKKARAILPPTAYDACMTEVGQPKVTIR